MNIEEVVEKIGVEKLAIAAANVNMPPTKSTKPDSNEEHIKQVLIQALFDEIKDINSKIDNFKNMINEKIELLQIDNNNKHAFHMYVIKLLNLDRDLIATEIEKRGVSVGVHYRPVHLEPYYANKFPDNIGKFPIAEAMGAKILTLPIWPDLSHELQQRVIDVVQEAL